MHTSSECRRGVLEIRHLQWNEAIADEIQHTVSVAFFIPDDLLSVLFGFPERALPENRGSFVLFLMHRTELRKFGSGRYWSQIPLTSHITNLTRSYDYLANVVHWRRLLGIAPLESCVPPVRDLIIRSLHYTVVTCGL